MRKIYKWVKRRKVQIMLVLFVTSFLLGFFGYWEYYKITISERYRDQFESELEPNKVDTPVQQADPCSCNCLLEKSATTSEGSENVDASDETENSVVPGEENDNPGTDVIDGIDRPVEGEDKTHGEDKIKSYLRPLQAAFFKPLFSTLKLYAGMYDATDVKTIADKIIIANSADRREIYCSLYSLWLARVFAFLLSTIAVVSVLKKFLPYFFARFSYMFWKRGKGKKILLVGNNEENIRLYCSAENDDGMLLASEQDKDTHTLWEQGVRWYLPGIYETQDTAEKKLEEMVENALEKTLQNESRMIDIVINTEDEEKNIHICSVAAKTIHAFVINDIEAGNKREVVKKLERVRIWAFGDKQHEQIYLALENVAYGTLHYTNKYHLASFDFVSKYPLTQYLTGDNADLVDDSGCIAEEAEFNVIFVGFGDTNREIFLDLVSTNQFVSKKEKDLPQLKQVHYYIFDKQKNVLHDKNLNHSLFRYIDDFEPLFDPGRENALNEADYLELPPKPFNYTFLDEDINSELFYDEIRKICIDKPRSINYLLIAFADDYDNVDLAQRMIEKKKEWNIGDLHIFVKVRDEQNEKIIKLLKATREDSYIAFGNEQFTLQDVLQNETEWLAYDRKRMTLNREFSEEEVKRQNKTDGGRYMKQYRRDITKLDDDTIRVLYDWYKMHQIMRRSNIYNILALKMKLQLLGLDYKVKSTQSIQGLKQQEYFNLYAQGCEPKKTRDPERYRGAMYDYDDYTQPEDYYSYLPRRTMAVQEHYRWNAYMIRCGFIPPKKEEIQNGFEKDYELRRHANLCSFKALFEFRDLKERKYGKKSEDVIGYDYKMMDEAGFFLPDCGCGYEIVRRE